MRIGGRIDAAATSYENSTASTGDTATLAAQRWTAVVIGPPVRTVAASWSQQHERLASGACRAWHPASDAGCCDTTTPWRTGGASDAHSTSGSIKVPWSSTTSTSAVDDRRLVEKRILFGVKHRSCRRTTFQTHDCFRPKRSCPSIGQRKCGIFGNRLVDFPPSSTGCSMPCFCACSPFIARFMFLVIYRKPEAIFHRFISVSQLSQMTLPLQALRLPGKELSVLMQSEGRAAQGRHESCAARPCAAGVRHSDKSIPAARRAGARDRRQRLTRGDLASVASRLGYRL